ncbi:MAG: twin-arginine translocase subunit TatC, partial [Verrucomicrobiota bacterium]
MEDLRWTLIKSVGVFLIFAVLIGFGLKEFNQALMWPLHSVKAEYPGMVIDLGTTSVMETFSVVLQICVVGGLVLAAPFILFFVGQFVAPALTEREMKLVLPVCGAAFALFLLGASFSFFLLVPSALRVSVELNEMFGFAMRWTPGSYYNLLLWLVAGVGASF